MLQSIALTCLMKPRATTCENVIWSPKVNFFVIFVNVIVFVQGGKRSVLVSEFMDKSDLRMLIGRPDLAPKFAWVSSVLPSLPWRIRFNLSSHLAGAAIMTCFENHFTFSGSCCDIIP